VKVASRGQRMKVASTYSAAEAPIATPLSIGRDHDVPNIFGPGGIHVQPNCAVLVVRNDLAKLVGAVVEQVAHPEDVVIIRVEASLGCWAVL